MFASVRCRRPLFFSVVLVATLALAGCASTQRVTLDSVRPAAVTFPGDVDRLLIVERTDRDHPYERIESILSGELPDEDRAGTQALINELRQGLRVSGRFDVQVAREMPPGLSLNAALPRPLAWDRVAALCEHYGADAAIVIEAFDTDFVVTRGTRVRDKDEDGKKTIEFTAEGVAHVTVGIRVYDPAREQIVDEKLFERSQSWEAHGLTIRDALLGLMDKGAATRDLSTAIGAAYTQRITPTPIRITRAFRGKYKKAPALERGTRFAEVGDWQQAKAVWEAGLPSADDEGAGYLSYNIAVAFEVLGDFDAARSWAERSYTQYGYREGRSYVTYLDRRRRDEALAERQYE